MDNEYECSPGEIIIEQGEEGRGFFILRAGTVEVYKDNLLLNVLQFPGTVFGGFLLFRAESISSLLKN